MPGRGSDTVGRLCQTILETLGAQRVSVWLLDPEGRNLEPYRAACASAPHPALGAWVGVPLREFPLAELALRDRRAVIVEDRESPLLPARFAAELDVRSAYCEPLVAEEPVGLLFIEPAGAADPEELASVLPLVASSAAQARAWQDAERRRVTAELLLELTEATAHAGSLEEALRELCQLLAFRLGVRRASVFLADGDRLCPAMSAEADGDVDPWSWDRLRQLDTPPPIVLAAQRTGEPLRATRGSELLGSSFAESFGVGTALAIPLVASGRPSGVLLLDSPSPHALSDAEVRLALAAASHAGRIIELAAATEERNLELRITTAVATLLERGAAARSGVEAACLLARIAAEALNLEQATVWLADAHGVVRDVVTWPSGADRAGQSDVGAKLEDVSLAGRLAEGEPLIAEDAQAKEALGSAWPDEEGPAVLVAFALEAGTLRRAVVACTARRPVRLGAPERRVARQLALEGALVLENAVLREDQAARLSELAHRALHDPLTGLANRELLFDRLGQALARAARRPGRVAVLFVDLDRFKAVNDTFGHDRGDEVLVAVAGRLRSSLRPEDTIARLAGDEFTVVLEDVASATDALAAANRVLEQLSRPIELSTAVLPASASIGVALSEPGIGATELLRRADQAMYAAKAAGRGRVVLYDPGRPRAELHAHELTRALATGGLVLYWQPIVELGTGRVLALEALVRWEHPTKGLVLPDQILSVAAGAGLERVLGWWVLETALERHRAWERAFPAGEKPVATPVSVNVSAAHFLEAGFSARLGRLLDRHDVAGSMLRLEVPAGALCGDRQANAAALAALARLGVAVYLDGFRTGASSLSVLGRYELAGLKLDRSLVVALGADEHHKEAVKAAVDLARDLGAQLGAVGIETEEQAASLIGLGCEQGQGYLYAPPLPEEAAFVLATEGPVRPQEKGRAGPRTRGLLGP